MKHLNMVKMIFFFYQILKKKKLHKQKVKDTKTNILLNNVHYAIV